MSRKYTGSSDGVAKAKRPGTEKLVDFCKRRWGFTNLGTLNVRLMRSAPAGMKIEDPKARAWLSVHATGRACDVGYAKGDRAKAVEAWDWLVANADALGIEEIHDYYFTGKHGQWGRGYRCDRKGKPLVKEFTATDNAGTPGGAWLHIELSPAMADDATKFEAAWRALPKPA